MNVKDFSKLNRWYQEHFYEAHFTSAAGGLVRYCLSSANGANGIVVLVNGRTEFIEKYFELMQELHEYGFSLGTYDHIGQGKSSRLLREPEKGHITTFTHYVADLQKMLQLIRSEKPGLPIYLVTHSMGGLIGALHVSENNHGIEKLVMSAPMLGIRTGRVMRPPVVKMISRLACAVGMQEAYVWGTGKYSPNRIFEHNALTTDKGRFTYNRSLIERFPEVSLKGPTFGWLHSAFEGMKLVRNNSSRITLPVLVFQAQHDRVVLPKPIEYFGRQSKNVQIVSIPGAKHEMFMEQDEIRSVVINRLSSFLGN